MTKQDIVNRIVNDLMDNDLINKADYNDLESLRQDVINVINNNINDITFIYTSSILDQ